MLILLITIILVLHNLTLSSQQLTTAPDYKLALKYSILYYEAQKSGKLPLNNRIKWRSDSAVDDHGINGEDLSGGYYDGSDFVKFSYPMAYSMIMLSWSVNLYSDIYKSIDEYNATIDIIKWATDYFIKCHVAPNELYGQVGDFRIDHKYWGRPEDMNMTRPAYKINETHPGSDLAAEVSAVFSSASLIFNNNLDPEYGKILLNHSIELYNFAKNYRGISKDVIPGAKQFYEEIYFYGDQLILSALWLFKATNNSIYLHDAEQWYEEFDYDNKIPTYFHFNEQTIGIRILLSEFTNKTSYLNSLRDFCNYAIDFEMKTPKGLIFIKKFGVLALAANIAFLCLEVAKFNGFPKEIYREFAKSQIDYILGSTGQSYLVGYGNNYPKRPFHSASSCPDLPAPCNWYQFNSSEPNPQIVYGALVSGPNLYDEYIDRREDFYFEYNVVGLDFNAGFQNALVALIALMENDDKTNKMKINVETVLVNNTNLK